MSISACCAVLIMAGLIMAGLIMAGHHGRADHD